MHLQIIIADDHPVVRLGVRSIISASGLGQVVAEASSADELTAALSAHPCDVLVTDFSMPNSRTPDGLSMIEAIRRRHPSLPILLLTMATNIGLLRMAMDAGVLGLLEKGSSMEELPMAIQTVHRGSPYVSLGIRDTLARSGDLGRQIKMQALSAKEMEVLRLLSSGMKVTGIAEHLHRSITTISRQKGDAMRKLGLKNDAELFEFLRNAGFTN